MGTGREKKISALEAIPEFSGKAFDLFPLGVVVHAEGAIYYGNAALQEVLSEHDCTRLLTLGGLSALARPEDAGAVALHTRACLKDLSAPLSPMIFCVKGGGETPRWLESRAQRVRVQGRPALLSVLQDVTAAREHQEALRLSDARFIRLAESSTEGVGIFRQRLPLFANRALLNMFGYESLEDLQAAGSFYNHVTPEYQQTLDSLYRAGDELPIGPLRVELLCRRKGGGPFWLEVGTRLVDWAGKPAIQVVCEDITAHKNAEEKIQIHHRRLNSILDTLPHLLAVKDNQKRYQMVNKPWLEFHGLTESSYEEIVKFKSAQELAHDIHGGHKETLQAIIEEDNWIAEHKAPLPPKLRYTQRHDGQLRLLRVHKAPILDERGELVEILALSEDVTESHRAEEAQQATQTLLKTIFDIIPHILSVKDASSTYLMTNPAWRKFNGLSLPPEFSAMDVSELPGRPPEEIAELLAQDRWVVENKSPIQGKIHRVTRGDGEKCIVETYKTPILDKDGAVAFIVGLTMDITERSRAEEELRASQHLLNTVLETIPLMVSVKNANSQYVMSNESWRKFIGVPPGLSTHELGVFGLPNRSEEDLKEITEEDQWVIHHGRALPMKIRQSTRFDKERRWIRLFKNPLLGENGEVIGMVSVSEDVTEYRKAEEELRESQRLLNTVVETIPLMVAVKNVNREYILSNESWRKFIGVPAGLDPGELKAFRLPHRPEEDLREITEEDQWVIQNGRSLPMKIRLTTRFDKERRWIRLFKNPLIGENGEVLGIVAVAEDVTEYRKAEDELRESQRLLQAVFNTIPHMLSIKDTNFRLLMTNAAWLRHHGMDEGSTPVGLAISEVSNRSKEELNYFLEEDRWVVENARPTPFKTITTTRFDGEKRNFEIYNSPIFDDAGKVYRILALSVDVTGRVRAEEELRANQRLLRAVFNTIPHMLSVKDTHSRILMVNQAWKAFSGVPDYAPLTQMHTLEFPNYPKEELGEFYAEDEWVIRHAKPLPVKVRSSTRADGQQRYMEVYKSPLLDESGKVTGVVGVTVDITERLEAELALRQREERSRDFSLLGSDLFLELGPDLTIQYASGHVSEVFGKKSPDLHGRALLELIPAGEGMLGLVNLKRALESQKAFEDILLSLRDTHGNEVIIKTSGKPLISMEGVCTGFRIVAVDITSEMEAEQEASRAQGLLMDAIESLPFPFHLYDNQDRLVLWNREFKALFSFIADSIQVGTPYRLLLEKTVELGLMGLPMDRDSYIQTRVKQFREGGSTGEQQFKNGKWYQVIDQKTRDGGTVSLRPDITELKQRELELRQSQKMEALGKLTGGVAHDFNNLLQIITGYIQLAQRKLGPGHPVQDYLGKMERAGTTAANLTRQLLAFSRKQMLHRSSVNLEDLIGNLLEMLKRVIPENVSFQSQIQKTIWPVLADPSKIEQVVMNLVINACDAMPDGGTLSLKAHNVRADERREVPEDPSLQGPLVILSIEDTGMGMTPEVMERVFEPFFTTKTQGKGTGLGLATVYGIVNQHQGRVMVQSQPGQGSRFTIYLPAHITTLEVRDDEAAEHTSATVQSAGRILLAEDDEAVRELAITVLGQAGYHVTAFPDGEKASLEFQSAPDKYDCAVLDVMMPHIGGVETFDRMVAIRPEFPVLFCSGYGEDQMQAIISRNLPYLQKPFMPDDLLRMVQALLTSRQV